MPYDHALSITENHEKAMRLLVDRLGWGGYSSSGLGLWCGGGGLGSSYVWVYCSR